MAEDNKWSDVELEAAVRGYVKMLSAEKNGRPYNKAEINKQLRSGPLAARSKGSVEYRMQNISAVLDELGLPWIQGYKPAKNVGSAGEKIRRFLADFHVINKLDLEPTADFEELNKRTISLRSSFGKTLSRSLPKGVESPNRSNSTATTFLRDPQVRAWVLENANGICEACNVKAPFYLQNGMPYLEVHHVQTLAEGGPDTIDNTVAVCPNCHRRLHLSDDRTQYTEALYKQCARLKRQMETNS